MLTGEKGKSTNETLKEKEARLPTPSGYFKPFNMTHSAIIAATATRSVNKTRIIPFFLYLFLFSLFISSQAFAQESNCSSLSFDKRAIVTQVYDGDTVKLANGEKIRLIGINTPEMNYNTGTPQPYAKKAKRFLEKRVLKKKVGIKYDKEKRDRYKRRLGHLFLLDGTNLQAEMLKSGLAFNITFPPNLWQSDCYKRAERKAQKEQLKIWKSPYYRPIDAKRINKSKLGIHRITGTVSEVLSARKTLWIQFSDKMALRINKKDLHYFKNLQPKQLIGKTISASGWISFYKHRFSMKIRHPNAITIH